jgi:hypothetical protein
VIVWCQRQRGAVGTDPGSLLSAGEINVGMLAMGAAQCLVQDIESGPPFFAGNLFFEFRLTFFAKPFIAIWGYPEFHCMFLPCAGIVRIGLQAFCSMMSLVIVGGKRVSRTISFQSQRGQYLVTIG